MSAEEKKSVEIPMGKSAAMEVGPTPEVQAPFGGNSALDTIENPFRDPQGREWIPVDVPQHKEQQ